MVEENEQFHSVSVEENHDTVQNLDRDRQGFKVPHALLFVLVSLVLFGICKQAYFINHLYYQLTCEEARELGENICNTGDKLGLLSQSFAHLVAESEVFDDVHILHWHMGNALLHKMDYNDGRLGIEKEGYYYVYSMVSFGYNKYPFHHAVMCTVPDFGVDYSRNLTVTHPQVLGYSNSYLSGVFHLCKGCNVFVRVSDTSNILPGRTETFFGVFMI